MELSARDRRILSEIECGSTLEDPKWVRRLEQLDRLGLGEQRGWQGTVGAMLLLGWAAAMVAGATVGPRPVLWAALGLGALGSAQAALWHRQGSGPWQRSARRRIAHIPRQHDRAAEDGDI